MTYPLDYTRSTAAMLRYNILVQGEHFKIRYMPCSKIYCLNLIFHISIGLRVIMPNSLFASFYAIEAGTIEVQWQ